MNTRGCNTLAAHPQKVTLSRPELMEQLSPLILSVESNEKTPKVVFYVGLILYQTFREKVGRLQGCVL